MSTVEENKVVALRFVAKNTETGEDVDRSDAETPMRYLHGKRNIIPGLEETLLGKAVGDTFEATIGPAKAYGQRPPREKTIPVRRSELPVEGKIEPGMSFVMRGPRGESLPVWVKKVQGRQVVCTPVHPLAGATLHFEGEILEIRDATEEEVAHGYVHAPEHSSTKTDAEE